MKEKGLKIVTSKVEIKPNTYIHYDKVIDISGKNYHLYKINKVEYNDYAYCVDVDSGELFQCGKDNDGLSIYLKIK